jgi:hypothetical protein
MAYSPSKEDVEEEEEEWGGEGEDFPIPVVLNISYE